WEWAVGGSRSTPRPPFTHHATRNPRVHPDRPRGSAPGRPSPTGRVVRC
ncbi:MAG: hypothetical protein AVDCRST_MAG40-981, partial [uncultured Gemmatimonadaceae bacterium]